MRQGVDGYFGLGGHGDVDGAAFSKADGHGKVHEGPYAVDTILGSTSTTSTLTINGSSASSDIDVGGD